MRDVSQALKGYRRLIAVIMIISLLVSITPFSSTYATTQPVTPMIAAGARHSLALKSDGTVLAWGRNDYGQLGNETTTSSSTPVQVSGLTNVTTVTAGWWHSLALELDGTVWAWGDNRYGQLGNETTTSSSKPVQVSNLSGVVAISSCLGAHSLALKSDGTVWAWGGNWYGQLGDGTTTMYKTTPVQVSGLSSITAIAAGSDHSLAIKQGGTVWAWGRNTYGQLGNGTTSFMSAPVQVTNLSGVTVIAVGHWHSLALKQDGTVWAWGYNGYGQLGDGTTANRSAPIKVSGLSNIAAIAAGSDHSLTLKQDGTIWAWGANYASQIGDGTTTNRYTPVQVDITLSNGSGDTPTQPTTTTPTTFTDIPADAWYKSYVDALVVKGIISGYPDGTFRPLNSITRAEFAKMVILAIGESPTTNTASSFTDVATSYWAHGYIERAKELGIINGYPDRTFKPAANVSRQEIAKMVVLAAKVPPVTSYRADFTDVPSTLWSWSYILAAKDAGIISGYPDNTFKPANSAIRAEASKMVEAVAK